MSEHRDKMRRRMNARGNNDGESLQSNLYEIANQTFDKSPTYRRMLVQSHQFPELKEIDARVMNIERMGDIREIIFRPYEGVDVGTYLTFDGETWLVYDRWGSIDGGKIKVQVERCTEKLRWKDKAGKMHEQFCVASATQLGSKANQGKNALEWNKFDVRLPLGQIFVFIEKNDVTKNLHLNQRFILGSNAYEVVGVDDVTSTSIAGYGFLQITVSVTTKNDKDDLPNKIAFNDYGGNIPPLDEDKKGRLW